MKKVGITIFLVALTALMGLFCWINYNNKEEKIEESNVAVVQIKNEYDSESENKVDEDSENTEITEEPKPESEDTGEVQSDLDGFGIVSDEPWDDEMISSEEFDWDNRHYVDTEEYDGIVFEESNNEFWGLPNSIYSRLVYQYGTVSGKSEQFEAEQHIVLYDCTEDVAYFSAVGTGVIFYARLVEDTGDTKKLIVYDDTKDWLEIVTSTENIISMKEL